MFLDKPKNKPNNSLQFSYVFGVPIAKITREKLRIYLQNVPKNQKIGLNFAYSEVVLRANRNKFYHKAISQIINICDGKGLRWSLWESQKYAKTRQNSNILQKSNNSSNFQKSQIQATNSKSTFTNLHRKLWFWIYFSCQIFGNFLSGILILTGFNFGMEIILGRDFVYDLFEIALQKKWKIAVIGGSGLVQENLQKKFPNLEIDFWFRENNSDLMKDLPNLQFLEKNKTENFDQNKNQKIKQNQPNLTQIHSFLSTQNLISNFPDLQNAEEWLIDKKADLILICIGGASGKQEFFLDLIRQNEKLYFDLGVCLGAALDHLGAGKKQRESPKIMQKIGLEWLFRLIFQPYRRQRIWDSVWTLFWWTTLSEFVASNQQVNLKNIQL